MTGQDGYSLARWLLDRGCTVIGAVQPGDGALPGVLRELEAIECVDCELEAEASVEAAVAQARPDFIYHLGAQSSVERSWREPAATARINAMGTLYLLEAMRRHAPQAGFVMAGSCDCYDHAAAGEGGVTPETPFRATNPYAVGKLMAQQLTRCWRDQHNLRASVAILFNHTSPRRDPLFVERGLVRDAVGVALGQASEVVIGSRATRRDWSWAEEIVEGIALMGAMEQPEDLVLGSGRTLTLGDWIDETFAQLGLDPARYLRLDPSRLHGGDRPHTFGNIKAARRRLGWSPRVALPEMVRRLIEADRAELTAAPH